MSYNAKTAYLTIAGGSASKPRGGFAVRSLLGAPPPATGRLPRKNVVPRHPLAPPANTRWDSAPNAAWGFAPRPPGGAPLPDLFEGRGDIKVHGRVKREVWGRNPRRGFGRNPSGGPGAEPPAGFGADPKRGSEGRAPSFALRRSRRGLGRSPSGGPGAELQL